MTAMIILAAVLLVLGLICMFMQKKYLEAYRGVFGKVSAFLFADAGLAGIGATVIGLLALLGIVETEDGLMLLGCGLVCIAIAALAFLFAARKYDGNKAELIFPMLVVGMATLVWASFMTVAWMFKLILHIEKNSPSGSGNFAGRYIRSSDGMSCALYSDQGEYAILHDDNGNSIEVWPSSGGNVYDNADNLYRPA